MFFGMLKVSEIFESFKYLMNLYIVEFKRFGNFVKFYRYKIFGRFRRPSAILDLLFGVTNDSNKKTRITIKKICKKKVL